MPSGPEPHFTSFRLRKAVIVFGGAMLGQPALADRPGIEVSGAAPGHYEVPECVDDQSYQTHRQNGRDQRLVHFPIVSHAREPASESEAV
jgi:hypothetical protein